MKIYPLTFLALLQLKALNAVENNADLQMRGKRVNAPSGNPEFCINVLGALVTAGTK